MYHNLLHIVQHNHRSYRLCKRLRSLYDLWHVEQFECVQLLVFRLVLHHVTYLCLHYAIFTSIGRYCWVSMATKIMYTPLKQPSLPFNIRVSVVLICICDQDCYHVAGNFLPQLSWANLLSRDSFAPCLWLHRAYAIFSIPRGWKFILQNISVMQG